MSDDLNKLVSDEQLVAYLDGELDVETERRIDHLLATNSNVRKKVNSLQQAWDALDELERPNVDASFTQATIALAATITARPDDNRTFIKGRIGRWPFTAGSLIAAGLAGFLCVAVLQSDPNRQLVQDLPILENLDQYRQIDDIEFLRMLNRKRLFDSEETNGR